MAIPLLAVGAGYKILKELFNRRPDYDLPPDPKFFGPEYDEVRAALRQRTQARYGGAGSQLRETLANQGVLGNQGALTDSFTRLSLGENQDISSGEAGLAESELGAQRNFQTTKYGAGVNRNRDLYAGDLAMRDRNLGLVSALGGSLGKGLASGGGNKPQLPGAHYPTDDPLYGSGLGFEDEDENPFYKKILKALLGFGG